MLLKQKPLTGASSSSGKGLTTVSTATWIRIPATGELTFRHRQGHKTDTWQHMTSLDHLCEARIPPYNSKKKKSRSRCHNSETAIISLNLKLSQIFRRLVDQTIIYGLWSDWNNMLHKRFLGEPTVKCTTPHQQRPKRIKKLLVILFVWFLVFGFWFLVFNFSFWISDFGFWFLILQQILIF